MTKTNTRLRTRQAIAAVLLAVGALLLPGTAVADDESLTRSRAGVLLPPGMEATQTESLTVPAETTTLFFNPMDSEDTNTVLLLTNTASAARSARVTAYRVDGTTLLDTTIQIPARGHVRITADPIAANPPPSWANAVLVNFTDFTAFARLNLRRGVIVEGYVVWNNASTYDPRAAVPRVPLRFWQR